MINSLNLIAPIGYTGYGVAGLNILKELNERGVEVSLFIKGNPNIDSQEEANLVNDAINRTANPVSQNETLKIWHQNDLFERVGKGDYFAYPFFELDEFNPKEQASIKYPDIVLSTSVWAASVVEQYTKEKSPVVPLGVDTTIFNATNHKAKKPRNSFVILNAGKWEVRKGHDILIEIFNKAFTSKDNVELWMLPHNPFLNPQQTQEWESLYKTSDLADKVWILPRQRTHIDLRNVMLSADIGIFPSHAEGWNLELLEMMALGKQVIATNYSAHTEFCNRANCYLIDITKKERAFDGFWFDGKFGQWAHIGEEQIDQTVEHLRNLYRQWKEDGGVRSNVDGIITAQAFSWQNTVNKLEEAMQ